MNKTMTIKELKELLKNYKDTDEIQLTGNEYYGVELTIETDTNSIEIFTLEF